MRGLSPEELKALILSVGTHATKRRYSPIEVAEKFEKAIEHGLSQDKVAKAMGLRGTTMVSRFIRLLQLNPAVQHIVDWGQSGATISFTSAWRLTQLSPHDQALACDVILRHQLTSPEVEQLVQLRKRSGRPVRECIKEVLRMRPTVEKRHVFIGAVTSVAARAGLPKISQANRDAILGDVLHTAFTAFHPLGARLGTDRFTIVSDEKQAALLLQQTTDFEAAVNSALEKRFSAR